MSTHTPPNICFYFQVHQPYRLRDVRITEIGHMDPAGYFDDDKNHEIFRKVAEKCYLPANALMLELLNEHDNFSISYSLSGVFLEQCEQYGPDVLESFQKLAATGKVEFLAETYYHSLSAVHSLPEFCEQVDMQARKIHQLFGSYPRIFRNTELIFTNEIAHIARLMGFRGILAEGADHVLQGRSPNDPYVPPNFHLPDEHYWQVINEHFPKSCPDENIHVLLKNYRLSDDVAFRFSDKSWLGHPLTAERFTDWVMGNHGHTVNLFMDYETFGEHQWADTGIFDFLRALPAVWKARGIQALTPSQILDSWIERTNGPEQKMEQARLQEAQAEAGRIISALSALWKRPTETPSPLQKFQYEQEFDAHQAVSWADSERDLSAWKGNSIQDSSLDAIYALEQAVKASGDQALIDTWRKLQTSDHFYYMCTKYWADGDVHKYFSPYDSPYEAYRRFSHVLYDLQQKLPR